MANVRDIDRRYRAGELTEGNDEKGAGGYWDLAVELAESLDLYGVRGMPDDVLHEQMMVGFYAVLQKVLVRRELYG